MSDDFKGRGGSPWGAPPGGGGNGSGRGPTPPDIDAIIRDIQNKINKFLPGGSKSGGKPDRLNINRFTFCVASKWII
jgi:membrane protease subunit HflK